MLNAAKIDEISKECLASTDKAISYLMKVTRRNGESGFFSRRYKGYWSIFDVI